MMMKKKEKQMIDEEKRIHKTKNRHVQGVLADQFFVLNERDKRAIMSFHVLIADELVYLDTYNTKKQ